MLLNDHSQIANGRRIAGITTTNTITTTYKDGGRPRVTRNSVRVRSRMDGIDCVDGVRKDILVKLEHKYHKKKWCHLFMYNKFKNQNAFLNGIVLLIMAFAMVVSV